MGGIFQKIRENTEGMSGKEKMSYILTYYWYHLLGIAAVLGLIVFLVVHFAFPEEKPLFTCALVNQRIDSTRDQKLAENFAEYAGLSQKQVVFDSDYIISYNETEEKESNDFNDSNTSNDSNNSNNSNTSNESGFDKFFFKWSGGELDAVVMTEDFMSYCIEVGGEFYPADEFDVTGLDVCEVQGVSVIKVSGTKMESELDGTEKDNLVLVFPDTGKQKENCQKFIDYLRNN